MKSKDLNNLEGNFVGRQPQRGNISHLGAFWISVFLNLLQVYLLVA
jgi:hypothetical protein